MATIVKNLKKDMQGETGSKTTRPSYCRFKKWVVGATEGLDLQEAEETSATEDLALIQPGDADEMAGVHALLRSRNDVIKYFLSSHVFPTTTPQHLRKISASAQELGGDLLFERRIGFSGTPSDLVPVTLGRCHFEPGDEARILYALTRPDVTLESEVSRGVSEWSATTILDAIVSSHERPFHALIDTGALITGFTNEEVARYLISKGLPHPMRGVVYLDECDNKMILLQGAAGPMPLHECGISKGQRFTFFDQVHTTGMDIPQDMNARALLTLSKDMTYRDFAQGAYRMRGIGKGQSIHLYIVPEVKKLMCERLPEMSGARPELLTSAWLLLNGMKMENLQFMQLAAQNMSSLWRKPALFALVEGVASKRAAPEAIANLFEARDGAHLKACVQALIDPIDNGVQATFPDPQPFQQTLEQRCMQHEEFMRACQASAGAQPHHKLRDFILGEVAATLGVDVSKSDTGLDSEVTKEKEQEQEQEMVMEQLAVKGYDKDSSARTPWSLNVLLSAPKPAAHPPDDKRAPKAGKANLANEPFYPLHHFSPQQQACQFRDAKGELVERAALAPLSTLPPKLLATHNFSPLSRGSANLPVRLKNVTFVLAWQPPLDKSSECFYVIVSLSEAESLRRAIHAARKEGRFGRQDPALALVMISSTLPTAETRSRSPLRNDVLLDATPNFQIAWAEHERELWTALHLWDSQMFYNHEQVAELLEVLEEEESEHRKGFFDAMLFRYGFGFLLTSSDSSSFLLTPSDSF